MQKVDKKILNDLEDIIYNLNLDIKTINNTLKDIKHTKEVLDKILKELKSKDEE